MCQYQLKRRYQITGETLQEFPVEVIRLTRLGYPGTPEDVLDRLTVQAFTDGIRDVKTKQAVMLSRSKIIAGALACALEYEATKQNCAKTGRLRNLEEVETEKKEGQVEIKRLLEELLARKKKPLRCWNCGHLGH